MSSFVGTYSSIRHQGEQAAATSQTPGARRRLILPWLNEQSVLTK